MCHYDIKNYVLYQWHCRNMVAIAAYTHACLLRMSSELRFTSQCARIFHLATIYNSKFWAGATGQVGHVSTCMTTFSMCCNFKFSYTV